MINEYRHKKIKFSTQNNIIIFSNVKEKEKGERRKKLKLSKNQKYINKYIVI